MLVKKYINTFRIKLYTEDSNSGINPIIFLAPIVEINTKIRENYQIGDFSLQFPHNYYSIKINNKNIELAANIYSMFMTAVLNYPGVYGKFKINIEIRHRDQIHIMYDIRTDIDTVRVLYSNTNLAFEGDSYSIFYKSGAIKNWVC